MIMGEHNHSNFLNKVSGTHTYQSNQYINNFKMKIAIAALLIGSAAAFAPVAPAFRTTALSAVATGPKGKAAKSAEEDLELTREVIRSFMGDDEPEEEAKAEEKEEE